MIIKSNLNEYKYFKIAAIQISRNGWVGYYEKSNRIVLVSVVRMINIYIDINLIRTIAVSYFANETGRRLFILLVLFLAHWKIFAQYI